MFRLWVRENQCMSSTSALARLWTLSPTVFYSIQVRMLWSGWAKIWLTDRARRVVFNGCYSTWRWKQTPWVSISVGPVLFNDLINDNGRVVECLKVFRWHQSWGSVYKLLVRVAIQRDQGRLWNSPRFTKCKNDKCKILHLGTNNLWQQ